MISGSSDAANKDADRYVTEEIRRLDAMSHILCGWYKANARTLPWRTGEKGAVPDPYHVWVSEIMLQQTRVEAVKKYYARFMHALPTVGDLAACPEERLLKLWEGLGYYNRARNLQRAAQIIMNQHGGILPNEYAVLLKLPGFGPYTAGAVASICFDEPVSAVDGNVLRVFARLSNDDSDVLQTSVRRRTERLVCGLLQSVSPGILNQALMELGETVCTPGAGPACASCPLTPVCLAFQAGTQNALPVRIKKTKRRIEHKTVLVICDSSGVVIRRRSERGLLAGMYELPALDGELETEAVLDWLREYGIRALRIQPLPAAKHLFSHVEWQMTGYRILAEDLPEQIVPQQKESSKYRKTASVTDEYTTNASVPAGAMLRASPEHLQERYPIPGAFSAYAAWVDVRVGAERYEKNVDG